MTTRVHGIVFLVFNQNKDYFKMFLLYLANIHIGQMYISRPNIYTEDKNYIYKTFMFEFDTKLCG